MLDSGYGVCGSPSHLKSYCCSLRPNKYIFVSSVFPKKVSSLSMWSAANFSRALWSCVWRKASFLHSSLSAHVDVKHTVDTYTCLTAASNSLQTYFLVFLGWLLTILTRFISAAGDSLCFLLAMHLQRVVCTVDLGICNCFEIAPSYVLTCSNQ